MICENRIPLKAAIGFERCFILSLFLMNRLNKTEFAIFCLGLSCISKGSLIRILEIRQQRRKIYTLLLLRLLFRTSLSTKANAFKRHHKPCVLLWKQFACNVKAYFLGKIRKRTIYCLLTLPENGNS